MIKLKRERDHIISFYSNSLETEDVKISSNRYGKLIRKSRSIMEVKIMDQHYKSKESY